MNEAYVLYAGYVKPWFAPPAWVFGPVWAVLYAIIAISFGYVFLKVFQGQLPKVVAIPFLVNLVANISFTPVQFGLNNLPLASIIIVIILLTIVWAMVTIWPYERWVAYAQIPYLLWVLFATILQLSITYLNS